MSTMNVAEFLESGELTEYVQENAEWYRQHWRAMLGDGKTIRQMRQEASWNWAACLLGPAWCFYRKMYIGGVVVMLFNIGVALFDVLTDKNFIVWLFLVSPVVLGMYGNASYLHAAYRAVSTARAKGTTETLSTQGGVSFVAAFVGPAILVSGLLFAQDHFWNQGGASFLQNVDINREPATPAESPLLTRASALWHDREANLVVTKLYGNPKFIELFGHRLSVEVDVDEVNGIITLEYETGETIELHLDIREISQKPSMMIWKNPKGEKGLLAWAGNLPEEWAGGAVPSAKPALPSSSVFTTGVLPGQYEYAEDGLRGALIVEQKGGAYSVQIETVNTGRMSTCSLNFSGGAVFPIAGPNGEVVALSLKDPESECSLGMAVKDGEAAIMYNGAQCHSSCGMGATVEGRYRRKK